MKKSLVDFMNWAFARSENPGGGGGGSKAPPAPPLVTALMNIQDLVPKPPGYPTRL